MAVAEDEQRDLTNFLQLISEFIANESAVLQLVEEPDFTTFCESVIPDRNVKINE